MRKPVNAICEQKNLYRDNRIEKKNTLGSEAKNRDGHTFFFWPYTFWFASFISFGLVRPRKNIVVTCVSGSLPKTIRIGRSTQLFYFIF